LAQSSHYQNPAALPVTQDYPFYQTNRTETCIISIRTLLSRLNEYEPKQNVEPRP